MPKTIDTNLERMYHGRRACVLGGAGFVGHVLVRDLLLHGCEVVVVDNFSRGRTRVRGASYLDIDILSMSQYPLNYLPSNLDYVFNLAAFVAGVDYNKNHNELMYEMNIGLLTEPLISWAPSATRRYLQTSSVCVYGEEYQIMSEEDDADKGAPHPANLGYSTAKYAGERVAAASGVEHVVIVRPSNIIGPRDYYDDRAHVLPHLVKRAFSIKESGGPMEIWGDPRTTREFVHSYDASRGMMYALAHGGNREVYNIGTSGATEVSIGDLALMVMKNVPVDCELVFNTSMGGGDLRRSSNANKLRSLGWTYQNSVIDGVVDAIEGYVYAS